MPSSFARLVTPQALSLYALLAALFAFCSEALLWNRPEPRSIPALGLVSVGYLAAAAVLTDMMARYRVQTFTGLMAVAGLYGMINGLTLNPDTALIDVPRTLITRVLGAHTLMGVLALSAFVALQLGLRGRGRRALLLILFALLGIGWGAWARWNDAGGGAATYNSTPAFALEPIIAGAVLIALAAGCWRWHRAVTGVRPPPPPAGKALIDPAAPYKLTPGGYALAAAALGVNLAYHLANAHVDSVSLTILIVLIGFVGSILWFQTRKKGLSLIDGIDAGTEPPGYWIAAALIVLVSAAFAHQLARQPDAGDPVAWFGALFTTAGVVWLPALTLIIGARALGRRARSLRL
ncbi:MAG: hypothetical protein SF162_20195 [bacterium]|nr:hypothetical protein [bacterium]